MKPKTLWHKDEGTEGWVTRFTVGDDYRWDSLLLPYDVRATRAHAWGLAEIGILSADELERAEVALYRLEEEALAGRIRVEPADEDCHTVIENFLTRELGEAGKKIHTGRSRNDQVLAALRLYLRDHVRASGQSAAGVVRLLCDWGSAYDRVLMPGYTHMQRAMPSTVGLWAMGYAELLVSDVEGLRHACDRMNVSPLGSAAGYGVPYLALPRERIAERLGFRAVQTHVTAVQLSRGKLEMEIVHALVQLAGTFNRLASDLVLFNTAEFGFVEIPSAFGTGSSIMPQKHNPDVLELARATYHRLAAELHLLLGLPANLSSGYHRDLQLTKEAVMRAVRTGRDLTDAMVNVLAGITFDAARLEQSMAGELFATARALELVEQGMPFRDAYRQAAAEVDTIAVPADPLEAYGVDGYPGRCRPDLVLERLAALDEWAE